MRRIHTRCSSDFVHQQVFTTGAGATDIDRWVNTLFCNLAIQNQLHITCAFKFFVDHFVHFRAGINQRGGDNTQAAAMFDISCSTKEALGLFQGVGVDTTGEYFTGGGDYGVVGAG